jgi:hypothetical protein
MGAGSTSASVEPDWLGVPMYFSHFDGATNRRLVQERGVPDYQRAGGNRG